MSHQESQVWISTERKGVEKFVLVQTFCNTCQFLFVRSDMKAVMAPSCPTYKYVS